MLDADEWVPVGDEQLGDLRNAEPAFAGALRIVEFGATSGGSDWISRVLPGPVRYAGRVHEQSQHALPVRRLAVTIGHDGYAAERMAAKRGRNRVLLEAELAQRPDDAYLWYQLGKGHAVYDEHAEAAAAFERAHALRSPVPCRLDLAARQLNSLKKLARHAEGLELAQRLLPERADSPDYFFALGDLMLDWAAHEPGQGADRLAVAQQALAIAERHNLVGAVPRRSSWLTAYNHAAVLEVLGDRAVAVLLHVQHPTPQSGA